MATSESILWDVSRSSSSEHVSYYRLLSSALGLKRFSEGNRKSPFNTVAHSFIHYELSICDSPGPVLCVGHDARMRGGL